MFIVASPELSTSSLALGRYISVQFRIIEMCKPGVEYLPSWKCMGKLFRALIRVNFAQRRQFHRDRRREFCAAVPVVRLCERVHLWHWRSRIR